MAQPVLRESMTRLFHSGNLLSSYTPLPCSTTTQNDIKKSNKPCRDAKRRTHTTHLHRIAPRHAHLRLWNGSSACLLRILSANATNCSLGGQTEGESRSLMNIRWHAGTSSCSRRLYALYSAVSILFMTAGVNRMLLGDA